MYSKHKFYDGWIRITIECHNWYTLILSWFIKNKEWHMPIVEPPFLRQKLRNTTHTCLIVISPFGTKNAYNNLLKNDTTQIQIDTGVHNYFIYLMIIVCSTSTISDFFGFLFHFEKSYQQWHEKIETKDQSINRKGNILRRCNYL